MTTAPVRVDTTDQWVEVAGRRWPVVEDIPFVRFGREDLADEALDALAAGDERRALVTLLGDRDAWAPGRPPGVDDIEAVVDAVEVGGSLRDAMRGLGYGAVGDYFAHRWSDPTFLSGLALLREAWPCARPHIVELACGIGQLLAVAADAGASVVGVDVVFSKLWLARRFVVSSGDLICADIERQPLPFVDGSADLVLIHDALYFIRNKQHVVSEARRVGRALAVGHAHNALADNLSAGLPLSPSAWATLLPGTRCYDDLELTASWLEDRSPRPADPADLTQVAAVAMIDGVRSDPPVALGEARGGRSLRLNPLYQLGRGDPVPLTLRWPSPRYRAEYAPLSDYLWQPSIDAELLARGGRGDVDGAEIADLLRRRVLLDLPERW